MSQALDLPPRWMESLIEVASHLKEAVGHLGQAYDFMPAVIERENKAIRGGDFLAIQSAVETKENAGARVEECFAELQRASSRLADFAEYGTRPPGSLKECVALLRDLALAAPADSMASQVLKHQVDGFAQVAQEFEARFSRIKPQIEANRALIGALLHNLQESYRYWIELSEQVATAYNPQGVQQTKGRHSGFKVTA